MKVILVMNRWNEVVIICSNKVRPWKLIYCIYNNFILILTIRQKHIVRGNCSRAIHWNSDMMTIYQYTSWNARGNNRKRWVWGYLHNLSLCFALQNYESYSPSHFGRWQMTQNFRCLVQKMWLCPAEHVLHDHTKFACHGGNSGMDQRKSHTMCA